MGRIIDWRRKFTKSSDFDSFIWKKDAEKTKKKYEKILTLMEPKEWYKASELIKDLDIKERRTRELLNELIEKGMLEEKGVTKGKRYRKK